MPASEFFTSTHCHWKVALLSATFALIAFASAIANDGHWSLDRADELSESVDTLEQRVKNHRDDSTPEFLWKRALAFKAAGRVDEAVAVCEISAREFPDSSARPLLGLAAWHREQNRAVECESACQRWFQLDGDQPRKDAALYLLAWAQGRQGRATEAATTFQRLVDECPQSTYWADAACRVAEHLRQSGQLDGAVELLQQVADRQDPQADEAARLALALVASQKQQWANVLDVVEPLCNAKHQRAHYLLALFWRAEATFRLSNHSEAEVHFTELEDAVNNGDAPRRFPADREKWLPIAWLRRAQIAAQREEWATVRELADGCRSEFATFARGFEVDYVAARALMAEGKLDDAYSLLEKVAGDVSEQAKETRVAALWMRGECRMMQRRYDEAETAYAILHDDANQPAPWRAMAWLQAGKCCEHRANWLKAYEHYQQAAQVGQESVRDEANQRLTAVTQRKIPTIVPKRPRRL
jgi:tetratricopeptide (TPR) repeat protein